MSHSSYVEKEWFFRNGSYQDRRIGEVLFDILKSFRTSFIPDKSDTLFHEPCKKWKWPDRFAMKLRMKANLPWRSLSSLRVFGGCILWMALILLGLRWIPLDVMMNLRNLSLNTLKNDFVRFIFNWWARILSNIVLKSWSGYLCCDF